MKIISPHKDYYDYLSTIYGIDDRIVYVRNEVKPVGPVFANSHQLFEFFEHYSEYKHFKLRYLVVNGRKYLFCRKNSIFEKPKWNLFDYPSNSNKWSFSNNEYRIQGYSSDELIRISKEVSSPIFSISETSFDRKNRRTQLIIDDYVPKLNEYGFESIIPAEQLYQETEYFLCNVLKDSPDTQPPVIISDKDMIESKGFDKVISFRHRKKQDK